MKERKRRDERPSAMERWGVDAQLELGRPHAGIEAFNIAVPRSTIESCSGHS